MSGPFRCGSPGRRQKMLALPADSPINGIDYLVVTDGDAVPAVLRQRLLRLRMFSSAGLGGIGRDQVVIEGGVRIPDPEVRWVVRLSEVSAPGGLASDPNFDPELSSDARDWLSDLAGSEPEPETWLLVMTETTGDQSQYRLRLREGFGSTEPPEHFDPPLSQVELWFKVECPTPFDCRTVEVCPPAPQPAVEIDYLARDFSSFRRLMLDRMALTQPEEGERHPASLDMAIIETLAYAADELSYYLDAVDTEAYLGTARNRVSMRRHARLRDYFMHEGCNARAFVQLQVAEGSAVSPGLLDGPAIETGAMLLTKVARHGTVIRPDGLPDALSQAPEVFETMHPLRELVSAHDVIAFHTFGDADCCLAAGCTAAALRDPGQTLRLQTGDFLIFEEIRDRETGMEADADPTRRHAVRLRRVGDSKPDALLSEGEPEPIYYVEVEWDVEDALPFPLWVGSSDAPLAVARGNVVLVDHGRSHETSTQEALPVEPFGHRGRVRARLPLPDLTWRTPYDLDASAQACLQQDPRQARPTVELEGEGERWIPQRDLLSSTQSSRDFVVETESDRRSWLRFGDAVHGRLPADGARFTTRYRVGNGPRGNVGAEAIEHLVAEPGLVSAEAAAVLRGVRNPLAATSGTSPESIDAVKLYAPHAFRHQERAVTAADWADVARRHPEVQHAVADFRWTGSGYTVFLTVDRRGGREVDPSFGAELEAFLERFRLAGYDLEVVAPHHVSLDIAMTVCVDPTRFADEVERQLYAELGAGVLPDGRLGLFHPDNLSFGENVHLSTVVARITAIPGVRMVDVSRSAGPGPQRHRFKRWGEVDAGELDAGVIVIGLREIARCDNDRNAPDRGQIRLYMEGGA